MICLVCLKEFAGRVDAKYCSDRCKKRFQRSGTDWVGLSGTSGTGVPDVVPDKIDVVPDKIEIACREMREGIWVDVEKDLGLDLRKDLGCRGWDANGIHILPDITVDQVRNIARLVAAKNGTTASFYEARL